jgi:hypothetical protein
MYKSPHLAVDRRMGLRRVGWVGGTGWCMCGVHVCGVGSRVGAAVVGGRGVAARAWADTASSTRRAREAPLP